MNLKEKVLDILSPEFGAHRDGIYKFDKINGGYRITIGQMYSSPCEINLEKLILLSELFGTTKIDVDDYANSGCESCDWGSNYGHTIEIYNPTQNVEELEKLCA